MRGSGTGTGKCAEQIKQPAHIFKFEFEWNILVLINSCIYTKKKKHDTARLYLNIGSGHVTYTHSKTLGDN